MYVAMLSFLLTAGNVVTSGSVAALSQASGVQVATFPLAPFAVAVDPVSATLFVSTITSIEQLCCFTPPLSSKKMLAFVAVWSTSIFNFFFSLSYYFSIGKFWFFFVHYQGMK